MSVFLTVIAGGLLACMMYLNGTLSAYTDPTWSSFVTHVVGTTGAIILVMVVRFETKAMQAKAPWWSYLGGILGAMTVIIANITFNSTLGVSGSFVLMLLGQTFCSILVDLKGFFGMPKRRIHALEYMQIALIGLGSFVLVFYAK